MVRVTVSEEMEQGSMKKETKTKSRFLHTLLIHADTADYTNQPWLDWPEVEGFIMVYGDMVTSLKESGWGTVEKDVSVDDQVLWILYSWVM